MARIFLSFYNATLNLQNSHAMPAFYESFIQGLHDFGNDVFVCSYGNVALIRKKIPGHLLEKIKKFDPELVILFNNVGYDFASYVDCPIVVYEVDSVLYYHHRDLLAKNSDRYVFLINQKDSRNTLQELLGIRHKNIYRMLPFSSVIHEDIPFTANISFIGSKFTNTFWKSQWSSFLESSPDNEEKELFQQILNKIKENPFLTEEEIQSQFKITSEKIQKNLNLDNIIFSLSDMDRIQTLSAVADLGLKLYGTQNWLSDLNYDPMLAFSYDSKKVYSLKHNQDIYNSSKICINSNHIQAINTFSWRVCDIMASNACLVTAYQPIFKEWFPDIPIPFYTNRYEAREQCVDLLKNESRRADIVAQCQEAIETRFRFHHLLAKMEQALSMRLSNPNNPNPQYLIETEYTLNNQFIDRWRIRFIAYAAILLLFFPVNSISIPFLQKRRWGMNELFGIINTQYQKLKNDSIPFPSSRQ